MDVIVDAEGNPFVLEINTLPGMTKTSLLPKAAAATGIGYVALCERMVELAFARRAPQGPPRESRIRLVRLETGPIMWLGKKKKNKRHQRRNVLDVKLRSDHVRALRARGLAVMLGVVFGTVFSLYVLWRSGEWVLDRLVYENRAFSIRHVEVATDGRISVDQLRRWSGVRAGQNLMALDLARVKSNLELVPNIRSVSVERLLPRTLRIRVIERDPVARLSCRVWSRIGWSVQTWLLDSEGAVMMPLESEYLGRPQPGRTPTCPC